MKNSVVFRTCKMTKASPDNKCELIHMKSTLSQFKLKVNSEEVAWMQIGSGLEKITQSFLCKGSEARSIIQDVATLKHH